MRSGLPCVMRIQVFNDCLKFARRAKSLQSCPTLWDPIDGSLSHCGHVRLFGTPRTVACQALLSQDSPDKNTGVGCHALLQGIFLTQGLSLCLFRHLHLQAGSLPWVLPVKCYQIIFAWGFVKRCKSSVVAVSEVSRLRHAELIPSINKHYLKNTYEMRSLRIH